MSDAAILSGIFIAIIVLAMLIGASAGVGRGFVMTAAILLGGEIALWWGASFGDRLGDLFRAGADSSRFLAGMVLLLLNVLVLGVAASTVISSGMPTGWGNVLGGLLGGANGALLIALALRLYYLAYAGRLVSAPLDDSVVVRVLWKHFDWFIVGFGVVTSILLLYTRFSRLELTVPEPATRPVFPRPVPPPLPKIENRSNFPELDSVAHQSNGRPIDPLVNSSDVVDNSMYAPPKEAARHEQTVVERATVTMPAIRNAVRYCPNCGMTLDATDHYCPDCGYTITGVDNA